MNKHCDFLKRFLIALTGILMLNTFAGVCALWANEISIEIVSVSVLLNDDIEIKYDLTDDGELVNRIDVYYIPDYDEGAYVIDFVYNPEPGFGKRMIFENNENFFPVNSQSISFRLTANTDDIVRDQSDAHSTIFLKNVESASQDCELAVTLEWLSYAIYPPGLEFPKPLPFNSVDVFGYKYIDSACVSPFFIGRVNKQMWDQDAVKRFDSIPGDYCFQLRAIGDGGLEATSNIYIADIDLFGVPGKPDSVLVDVLENKTYQVTFVADSFGFSEFGYQLYSSSDHFGDFQYNQTIDHTIDNYESLSLTDELEPMFVHEQDGPMYYYVKAYRKDCPDRYMELSDTISSIFLKAELDHIEYMGETATSRTLFQWDHDPKLAVYFLERQMPGEDTMLYVKVIDHTNNNFDDVITSNSLSGAILYRIGATNGVDTIRSNKAQVFIDPINVPHNAFRPARADDAGILSQNSKFAPETVAPGSFRMIIYDRNGRVIYQTESPDFNDGWDGTIDGPGGQPAPDGAYIYHMNLTDNNGTTHEKRGVVYLIK